MRYTYFCIPGSQKDAIFSIYKMQPPPKRLKDFRGPARDFRDIISNPGIANRLSAMLTPQEAGTMRVTGRLAHFAFKDTFQTNVERKWNIDIPQIQRHTLSFPPGVELWAAGSSVLLSKLQQTIGYEFLARNRAAWENCDLDLYINPAHVTTDAYYDLGLIPAVVQTTLALITSMGYTETQHFQDDWQDPSRKVMPQFADDEEKRLIGRGLDEKRKNAGYSGGFMTQNTIRDIYTLVKNTDPSIQIQLVVIMYPQNVMHPMNGVPPIRDIREVINNFDLTCCSVGFNFKTAELYVSPDAVTDIEALRMTLRDEYHKKFSQGNYILHKRVAKYTARGFVLTNPQPHTFAVMRLRKAIARLQHKKDILEIKELRHTWRHRAQPVVSPDAIDMARTVNTIALLTRRIGLINENNFDALVHASAQDKIDARIREYENYVGFFTREVARLNTMLPILFAQKLAELLANVPHQVPKNNPRRQRLHQFNLDRRMYESVRFTASACGIGDQDPISLADIDTLVKQYEVFKRVAYLPRANVRGDDESEREDVESDTDTPMVVKCYSVDLVGQLLERELALNRPPRWPDTMTPISDVDVIRLRNQYATYKDSVRLLDFQDRLEKQRTNRVTVEREGNTWQKVLIGGKVVKKRRSLPTRVKSPLASPRRKSVSYRRKSIRRKSIRRRSPRRKSRPTR